jgi:hypothetical protein
MPRCLNLRAATAPAVAPPCYELPETSPAIDASTANQQTMALLDTPNHQSVEAGSIHRPGPPPAEERPKGLAVRCVCE